MRSLVVVEGNLRAPRAGSLGRRARTALFLVPFGTAVLGTGTKAFAQDVRAADPANKAPSQDAPAANEPGKATAATSENAAYAKATAEVASDLSLEDLLNVDVTTASKFAEKQSDSPGIISVLSSDDIKRFGGTTLLDILDRVPGLNASSGYLTDRATIAARGDQVRFNSGHILLLLNGRPVRESMEGGLSSDVLERFPVGAIDRIEVIKGPGSVLYGSDAFSGVVNIITKDVTRTGMSVTGMVGSHGSYDPSAMATIRSGDLKILLTARYLDQPTVEGNYLFRPSPTAAVPAPAVQALPINGPDRGKGAFLDANYKGLRLMGTYTDWTSWYQLKGIIADGTWKKAFANLGYSYKIDKIWTADFNVGYTNAILNFYDNRPFAERHSDDLIGEWTNFVDVTDNARLVIGGLVDTRSGKETNHAPPINHTTVDARQVGVQAYAQMDYRPWRQLKFIGGVQANKMGDLALGAVPRIGVIASPTPRINFKTLYSTAYRAPSIEELFLQDVNLRGTTTLKPEKVTTLDFGVSYQGEQFQLGASCFESKQTNIIRPVIAAGATGVNALQYYQNTSGVQLEGTEFEGKVYVTRSVYVVGSAMYQRSRNDQGLVGVTPIPSVGTKAGVSYMADNGLTLSLFDIYQGSPNSRYQNTINTVPKEHNVLNLHGALDINRALSAQFKPNVTLLLQVNNLLDDKYYIPEWGGTVHDAVPGSIGRTIYGGASLAL